jgi:hypothetical protein
MARDFIAIGSTPHAEDCAQVGSTNYYRDSVVQCRAYARLLARLLPLPTGVQAELIVKTFEHDFGTYREVCVNYDPSSLQALNYAYSIDNGAPARWDAQAHWDMMFLSTQYDFQAALARGEIKRVPPFYDRPEPPALMSNDSEGLRAMFSEAADGKHAA